MLGYRPRAEIFQCVAECVAGVLMAMLVDASEARAANYALADGLTTITLSWNHAGLSRNFARIVGVEGTLQFDPAKVEESRLDVRIDPTRISSGVPALDRLLRSVDFFDATAHPAITFRSTNVVASGERTGEVTGELSIRGTAKPVVLSVVWNFSGEHPLGLVNPSFAGKYVSGFSAKTKLLRSDWSLERGAPLISDEIDVQIEVETARR